MGQLFVIAFLPPIWPMIKNKLEFEVKLIRNMIWVIEKKAAKPPCKLQGEGNWIFLRLCPPVSRRGVLPAPPIRRRGEGWPPFRSWIWNNVVAYVDAFAINDR